MAAMLKKRALAEYTQVIQEDIPEPRKKLRLIHKPKVLEPPLSFHGINTPDDVLQALLKFERAFPIEAEHLDHCMRLLLEQYNGCKDSALRAKIASLCGLLSRTPNVDITRIVNDILNLLKNEESNKVKSQLLESLLICGQVVPYNKKLHHQVVTLALELLSNSNHLVKSKCLNTIGLLGFPDLVASGSVMRSGDVKEKHQQSDKKSSLQQTMGKFTHDADSRVRMTAFEAMLSWHQRGLKLEHGNYEKACQALSDDYEGVRSVAIKLIWVLSQIYPDRKVKVEGADEENRLIDDGFAKICDMINDGSVNVRTEAASLLGSLHGVSEKFLDQTLEKMLMKEMQKRKSTTDKLRDNFGGGGFSSGKKWADDAPKEAEDSVTVMAIGACGAFVHGLEDEFMEVRMASIDSVCELATRSERFAIPCVDVLVDMFNDEIEAVQLNAINSLRKISQVIVLREDQLEVIMGCMKAQSFEVREAFRNLLGCVKFATRYCLNSCVSGMLELLKKYPQDRQDLWKCMKNVGTKHPSFVLSLTPDLLSCHPYFEAIEPDVEDPAYVAVLLLVLNAAVQCPSIVSLFPEHTVRHYTYLRDTLPSLVPQLILNKAPVTEMFHSPQRCVSPNSFLHQTLDRLQAVDKLDSKGASELMRMGIRDLGRVSELEATLAPNAVLMSMYLECHLCLGKVLTQSSSHTSSFIKQSPMNSGPLLNKVVSLSHVMEHQFLGLAIGDRSQIVQLRILALSIQLLGLLQNNLTGMKQSCVQYLQILNNFERFLLSNNLAPNNIMQSLISNMQKLESCDPAVYHSVLSEAVCKYKPQLLRLDDNVKQASACIIEPSGTLDNTITFITGLSVSVPMVININDLEDTSLVRIQVKYPDQQLHTFIPKKSDFRQLSPCRHRLITTVLLSHQQWSEACQVDIGVVLCYTKDKEFTEDRTSDKCRKSEDYIQLCKPLKLNVAPKALKK